MINELLNPCCFTHLTAKGHSIANPSHFNDYYILLTMKFHVIINFGYGE
jgi:hypothetical protein